MVYIRLYHVPSINVVYYFKCSSLAVLDVKILIYPCHQVVLKGTFNDLMKEIRRQKGVDISARKSMGKWLRARLAWEDLHKIRKIRKTYNDIAPDPIFFPDNARIEAFDDEISSFMFSTTSLPKITIQIFWFRLAPTKSVSSELMED